MLVGLRRVVGDAEYVWFDFLISGEFCYEIEDTMTKTKAIFWNLQYTLYYGIPSYIMENFICETKKSTIFCNMKLIDNALNLKVAPLQKKKKDA